MTCEETELILWLSKKLNFYVDQIDGLLVESKKLQEKLYYANKAGEDITNLYNKLTGEFNNLQKAYDEAVENRAKELAEVFSEPIKDTIVLTLEEYNAMENYIEELEDDVFTLSRKLDKKKKKCKCQPGNGCGTGCGT
jgi:hypothetical protein